YEGLLIDPCIPGWKGFTATRKFRGKIANITVKNPKKVEKGVVSITLNGKAVEGNVVPFDKMKKENEIVVVMG
ncbi:MAG: hypothetical protein IKP99_07560, partial [Bacteroidales bacterium]|nr:hypothetical protein [Bacteroidales bacterium]